MKSINTKTFLYRGYTGSVEYSVEDKMYYGQILNTRDLIQYEAETLGKLKTEFEDAVDDYKFCLALLFERRTKNK
jgi:predicted HicB family RNase H-like nuclease